MTVFVDSSQTDQGPPPPPPPIYADKTRGSKVVVDATLQVTFRHDPEVTPRCEQQGAVLWLRSALGTWYKGIVAPEAFVEDDSGYVRLLVKGPLDANKILVQPQEDDWAQAVELGLHDSISPAFVSSLA